VAPLLAGGNRGSYRDNTGRVVDMTPVELNVLVQRLSRGRSILIRSKELAHTCYKGTLGGRHPAYTDSDHCGKCWVETQEDKS
jgi:hypothetical protein